MPKFIDKMLNMIGFGDDEEDQFDDNFIEESSPRRSREKLENDLKLIGNKKGKIVNINTTTQLKVVIVQPESFEEAKDIADTLKTKNPVVINLEDVSKDESRRIVDFLSGSVYALDGNIQKISNGIFLITPYNVGIMGDFKDELRNKGIFPWTY